MNIGLHIKYPSFLSDFNETFSGQIWKNTETSIALKICPVEDIWAYEGRGNREQSRLHVEQFYDL
jgi:hypothetical protein